MEQITDVDPATETDRPGRPAAAVRPSWEHDSAAAPITSDRKPGLPDRPYARISVQRSIAAFAAFWPRSTDYSGSSRHFVFQCADVLEVWCDTIGRAQGIEPLLVAVLDAQD